MDGNLIKEAENQVIDNENYFVAKEIMNEENQAIVET